MIKVGIIEDDRLFLDEITDVINASDQLDCVMSAGSAEQFLKYFTKKTEIDIILFDIDLPGISGIEAIIKIKKINPDIQAIILSIHHNNDTIFRALRSGATGYLIKDTVYDKLEKLLIDVRQGIPALSPAIASRIINFFDATSNKSNYADLTLKEIEVLKLLVEGFNQKRISSTLDVSINTLRWHIKNIYKKLHVNSQPEVMRLYMDGKIDLD